MQPPTWFCQEARERTGETLCELVFQVGGNDSVSSSHVQVWAGKGEERDLLSNRKARTIMCQIGSESPGNWKEQRSNGTWFGPIKIRKAVLCSEQSHEEASRFKTII